jgi:hypothetical protein
MAFFTEAIKDGTIDKRTKMSEHEVENAIIARIMNSSAWDLHERRFHKDGSSAHLSTVAQEGGFSEIERHAGQREENRPAISYDSNTKNFSAGCNCGKEKFVFNMREDKVESVSPSLKMKDINAPYQKNNQDEARSSYGNNNSNYGSQPTNSYTNISGYSSRAQVQNSPYKNSVSEYRL